jgi:hypothetical protein
MIQAYEHAILYKHTCTKFHAFDELVRVGQSESPSSGIVNCLKIIYSSSGNLKGVHAIERPVESKNYKSSPEF